MFSRPFWTQRIRESWEQAPIVWLSGVRRSGKTTLAGNLGPDRTEIVNCDLPVSEERVRDPEFFFRSCKASVVVFDEIHQLRDPSRVLKIGADLFPHLKILATGSSTLAANRKFRDTLTGRKRTVHLLPVLWEELATFGVTLAERLHFGGLPQALLAGHKQAGFYHEWLDSFFARDVQRVFAFRDVDRFNMVFEYLLKQSGGQFEVSKAAGALGITRGTIDNHLRALEATHAVTIVRPFHGGGRNELVKMPKVYGFDTGFVSYTRGWDPLRSSDMGVLWEHLVLEHLLAHLPDRSVRYWRDKAGHEVDFVVPRDRDEVDAIECKWDPTSFDPAALELFRRWYPLGRNFVVTPGASTPYLRRYGDHEVTVCAPSGLPSDSVRASR